MITKTLKTTTGRIKVSIPADLTELNIGQMIAINETVDLTDLDAISILSGVTIDVLKNIQDIRDISVFNEHILSLVHKMKYCYNGADLPEYVYFGQNKVKVMRNLSIEPAGAFMASRDIIADEINKHIHLYGEEGWRSNFNPNLNSMAMVLSHYFYCRVTGNVYSEQLAEAFKEEVVKLPLQTALPIARHFFLAYPNLLKQKISLWARLRQSWRNALASRRLKDSRISTQ